MVAKTAVENDEVELRMAKRCDCDDVADHDTADSTMTSVVVVVVVVDALRNAAFLKKSDDDRHHDTLVVAAADVC